MGFRDPVVLSDGGTSSYQMGNKAPYLVILVLVVLSFSLPIFDAGFYFDDAAHSVVASRAKMQGKSRLTFAAETFDYMVSQQGRPAVSWSFIILPLQAIIGDNLLVYRLVHFGAWAIALWSALALFRQLSGAARGILPLVLLLALTQFRNWHDGVLNYFLFVPILVTTGAWTVIFWHRGLARPTTTVFVWVLAPFFFMLGLLSCNEFTLAFFPIVCAIALFESAPLKAKGWSLLPLVLVTLCYLVLNVWLKTRPSVTYWGVTPGPPGAIPQAYLIQFLSTFPFTCALFNPNAFMTHWLREVSLIELCIALPGAVGAGVLTYRCLTENFSFDRYGRRRILLAGASLLCVPPLLTAISTKYQSELRWGWGYLQVTLQVLGLVFLLVAMLAWLEKSAGRNSRWFFRAAVLFSLATATVFLGHSVFNQRMVARLNAYNKIPRDLCRTLLEHYSFSTAAHKPISVVIDAPWLNPWEVPEFFYYYSRRSCHPVKTLADFLREPPDQRRAESEMTDLYYLACPTRLSPDDAGVIVLGRLSSPARFADRESSWTISGTMLATRSLADSHYRVTDAAGSVGVMACVYRDQAAGTDACSLYRYDPAILLRSESLVAPVLLK